MIGKEHRPTTVEEERQPGVPHDRRLRGWTAVDPHDQRSRIASRRRELRSMQSAVYRLAVVAFPLDGLGLGQVERFEATERAASNDRAVDFVLVDQELCRAASTGESGG